MRLIDLIRSLGSGLASGFGTLQAPILAVVSGATNCIALEAWGGARTVVLLVGLAFFLGCAAGCCCCAAVLGGVHLTSQYRAAVVQYVGDETFHMRFLLAKTSKEVFSEVMGWAPPKTDKIYWIVTPDGDIYVEAFVLGKDISAMALYDAEEEVALPRTRQPPGKRLATVYGFEAGRGPGLMTPLLFARSLQAVQDSEAKAKKDGGLPDPALPPGPLKGATGKGVSQTKLPNAPDGRRWLCVWPPGVAFSQRSHGQVARRLAGCLEAGCVHASPQQTVTGLKRKLLLAH